MYRDLNDYELLYYVSDSDDFEVMVLKYKPLMNKIINKYLNITRKYGYEYDDLYQICTYALYNTLKTYDENENNMFYTYLVKALENSIKNIIKENNRDKKKSLNESISYNSVIPNTDITYLELFPDYSIKPYDEELNRYQEYIDIKNSLSFNLACVFELMIDGYTSKEIKKLMELTCNEYNLYARKIRKQLFYYH